jgi:hypothetical protein
MTGYALRNRGSIPDRGVELFLYPLLPAGSGAHPASCTMGTCGSFPEGKCGRGVILPVSIQSSGSITMLYPHTHALTQHCNFYTVWSEPYVLFLVCPFSNKNLLKRKLLKHSCPLPREEHTPINIAWTCKKGSSFCPRSDLLLRFYNSVLVLQYQRNTHIDLYTHCTDNVTMEFAAN